MYGVIFEIYTDHKSLKYFFFSEGSEFETASVDEFLEDYECMINYHSGKANVVTDALSRKTKVVGLIVKEWGMVEEISRWNPKPEN